MSRRPAPSGVPHSPPDGLDLRAERRADEAVIAAVVEAAFGSPAAARLVEAIRASAHFVPELSLVAEFDGGIVGHVMVSGARLHDGEAHRSIAMLSPLAVRPEYRRRGIGSALVHEVVTRAEQRGEPLVVLEGDPGFYGRRGFEPSLRYGIQITLPSWAPPEAAQLVRLSKYDPSIRGRVLYPPAFDAVSEH